MLLRVLKNNPKLLELTKIYFDAMPEFNMGKASAVNFMIGLEIWDILFSQTKVIR